jgi:5-enolpyruvylshikimate-3-phosphate synthase
VTLPPHPVEPAPPALRDAVWDAIDKLPTVPVEWAPAHSAPYVSRELVKAVALAAAQDHRARERARLAAAVQELDRLGVASHLVTIRSVLALLASPAQPGEPK